MQDTVQDLPPTAQAPRAFCWVGAALGAALLLAIPVLVEQPYWRRLVNLSMIWVLLTLSFNFILGFAGQLSLAHGGFFAVGAYTSALLTTRLPLSFWAGLAGAVAVSVVLSALVGLPLLRLRTHYLALATLGFSTVVRVVANNWKSFTGGHDGILNIPPPVIGRWVLRGDAPQYYLILTLTALLIWTAHRLSRSRYGLGFRALRDSELAAEMVGINTHGLKLLAFTLSGVYAGIAGSMYAHLFEFLSPEAFGIQIIIHTLAMLLIGGAGTIGGPVVGAVLLNFLPEWFRAFKEYYMLAYGVGLVVLIVFMPGGIAGAYRGMRGRSWATRDEDR